MIRLKYLFLTCVLLVNYGCVADEPEVFSLERGMALPDFSVVDNSGREVSPAALRGKVFVIVFVNTSCDDCRKELAELQKVYDTCASEGLDVRFIMIGRAESEESMGRYWGNQRLTLPYSSQRDDEVYRLFASQGIPRIYIGNSEGVITFTSGGKAFTDGKTLEEEFKLLFLNAVRN